MPAIGAELSCYTANLLVYRSGATYPARAAAEMARSVRLAVRPDPVWPAFSHHASSLARLPDGTHLAYAVADGANEAIRGIGAELARHHQVMVVANTAGLPWAPGFRAVHAAHWLLVDGYSWRGWHVRDEFAGLLPQGQQHRQSTWLSDAQLGEALTPVSAPTPAQRLREEYAFGFPVPVPAGGRMRWLIRRPGAGPPESLPGTWLTNGAALRYLAGWFAARGSAAQAAVDDVWALARHQSFRFDWLDRVGLISPERAEEAKAVWRQLVQSLRFALQSARRGCPRTSMIEVSFHAAALSGHSDADADLPAMESP